MQYTVNDSIKCDRYKFEGQSHRVKTYIDSVVDEAKSKGMIGEGIFEMTPLQDKYGYYIDVNYHFVRNETREECVVRLMNIKGE